VLADLDYRALQSDRVTILVGSTEEPFRVPGGLLIHYSPSFQIMCQSSFKESLTGVIKLPEVEIPTFQNFLIWLHHFQPSIQIETIQPVVDLAIFAETYLIYHLRNQTSDTLRAVLSNGKWNPTPEEVSTVYVNVPSGCILRKLCSFGFAITPPQDTWTTKVTTRHYPNTSTCRSVFENSADFGWDYFLLIQSTQLGCKSISEGGACRFHDHSDVISSTPDDSSTCRYAQGGPWTPKAVANEATKEFQEHGL
jgi:hypothetical protein